MRAGDGSQTFPPTLIHSRWGQPTRPGLDALRRTSKRRPASRRQPPRVQATYEGMYVQTAGNFRVPGAFLVAPAPRPSQRPGSAAGGPLPGQQPARLRPRQRPAGLRPRRRLRARNSAVSTAQQNAPVRQFLFPPQGRTSRPATAGLFLRHPPARGAAGRC